MSGLVYGLQNRPRRFESATDLRGVSRILGALFLCVVVGCVGGGGRSEQLGGFWRDIGY